MNLLNELIEVIKEMDIVSSPILVFLLLLSGCLLCSRLAENESYVGIFIPDEIRPFLLIFSFQQIKVSIFCIISQMCLYVMAISFLLARLSLLNWDLANIVFYIAASVHIFALAVGNIETAFFEWRHRD